jgi:hypothetical protein
MATGVACFAGALPQWKSSIAMLTTRQRAELDQQTVSEVQQAGPTIFVKAAGKEWLPRGVQQPSCTESWHGYRYLRQALHSPPASSAAVD